MHGPTVAGALTSVLGPDYVMDRRKHMHNSSSQGEQAFHKDCQRGKSLTGHMPRCCMIFYAPGGCTEAMGPTEILYAANSPSHFGSACRLPYPPESDPLFAGLARTAFAPCSAPRLTRMPKKGHGTRSFTQRRTWCRTKRWLPCGKAPSRWCTTYAHYPVCINLP